MLLSARDPLQPQPSTILAKAWLGFRNLLEDKVQVK